MMQDFQGKFDQFASNNIVGCRLLTSVFYEDPLYCLPLFFSNFVGPLAPPPSHTHTHTPQYTPLFLLLCFFDWMGDFATSGVILLDDIMDIYMPSLGIWVPQGPKIYFTEFQNVFAF